MATKPILYTVTVLLYSITRYYTITSNQLAMFVYKHSASDPVAATVAGQRIGKTGGFPATATTRAQRGGKPCAPTLSRSHAPLITNEDVLHVQAVL